MSSKKQASGRRRAAGRGAGSGRRRGRDQSCRASGTSVKGLAGPALGARPARPAVGRPRGSRRAPSERLRGASMHGRSPVATRRSCTVGHRGRCSPRRASVGADDVAGRSAAAASNSRCSDHPRDELAGAQPPCSKPPRRSSSGRRRPASRHRASGWLTTTTLLVGARSSQHSIAGARQQMPCRTRRIGRPQGSPTGSGDAWARARADVVRDCDGALLGVRSCCRPTRFDGPSIAGLGWSSRASLTQIVSTSSRGLACARRRVGRRAGRGS